MGVKRERERERRVRRGERDREREREIEREREREREKICAHEAIISGVRSTSCFSIRVVNSEPLLTTRHLVTLHPNIWKTHNIVLEQNPAYFS